jgi:hypothetical protein
VLLNIVPPPLTSHRWMFQLPIADRILIVNLFDDYSIADRIVGRSSFCCCYSNLFFALQSRFFWYVFFYSFFSMLNQWMNCHEKYLKWKKKKQKIINHKCKQILKFTIKNCLIIIKCTLGWVFLQFCRNWSRLTLKKLWWDVKSISAYLIFFCF